MRLPVYPSRTKKYNRSQKPALTAQSTTVVSGHGTLCSQSRQLGPDLPHILCSKYLKKTPGESIVTHDSGQTCISLNATATSTRVIETPQEQGIRPIRAGEVVNERLDVDDGSTWGCAVCTILR